MLIHVAIASVHTEQLLSSLTVASTEMIISSNKLIFFPLTAVKRSSFEWKLCFETTLN